MSSFKAKEGPNGRCGDYGLSHAKYADLEEKSSTYDT